MTQAPRVRSVLGPVLAVLLSTAFHLAAPAAVAHARTPSPYVRHHHPHHRHRGARSPSARPGAPTGLAGNRAGQGREHPGRLADSPDLGQSIQSTQSLRSGPAATAGQDGSPGPADGPPPGPPGPWGTPPAGGPGSADDGPAPSQPQSRPQDQAQIPGPYVTGTIPPVGSRPQAGPTASPVPAPGAASRPQAAGVPRRAMRVLPFGMGLALVGLGMAVIALRLRRR